MTRPSVRPDVLVACAIAVAAAMPYLGTFTYGFTHWDDTVILTQNPAVRHWSPQGMVRALTSPAGGAYLPTRLLLHMVEYRLWGLDARGYHIVNVLLNSLACAALFGVAAHVASRRAAAVAVLLYACHPAHVEAVAWVSGRKEVLSSCLMFAALWLFMARERRGALGPLSTAGVAALALAAMFAKPTAVVLPGLLLAARLAAATLDRRHARGHLALALLFALAAAAALVHAKVAVGHDVAKPPHGGSFARNASFAAHALAEHVRLCVLPVRLATRYMPRSAGLWHIAVALGVLAWVGAACVGLVRARRLGVPGFCVLWFCIALAPTSTILFPTSTTIADRYVYVPSFGVCLLAAWALDRVRTVRWVGLSAAAAALAALALARCPLWQNDGSLWRRAVVDSPNVANLHLSLAAHYSDSGLYRRAQGQIERVLGPDTTIPRAVHNLAVAKHRLGQLDQALRLFQKAVDLHGPDSPAAAAGYNGMGLVLRDRGDLAGSVHMFREALRVSPGLAVAQSNLARALAGQGRAAEAVRVYGDLLAQWPDDGAAHLALGKLLYAQGDMPAAQVHLGRARTLGISPAACEAHIGLCYLKQGDVAAAKQSQRRAMALDPYAWEAHFLTGMICEAIQDPKVAAMCYSRALECDPQAADAAERLHKLQADGVTAPE